MWVRRGSTNLMAGKVVFLRGLLSPIRVVDLTVMNPLRILFEEVRSALKARTCHFSRLFPSYICQKKTSRLEANSLPGSPFRALLSSQLFSSCIQGSSESVQKFAARINKLGTQIFHSSNTAQNTDARNANDQLLQFRFISGLRNDIRRFVLARDPNNLEESINAALIEEQTVKLNQIANDERTGLSPLQKETSVISALTNELEEIYLRIECLQEASSVTARKIGGGLFRRRETVFKCFYCGFEEHKQAECRKRRAEERKTNYQPPWGNAAGEFSVFRQPNTHSFDQRRVHFHESAFRDNYAAPRHSANVSQSTSRGRGDVTRFRRNTRNGHHDMVVSGALGLVVSRDEPRREKYGLHRNVGASRFNEPHGRQGCVLARTVEPNQSGRFDGNESVADSFRSGAVSIKSTHMPFLEAFSL
ncbi:hypothetical protein TNCV_2467911 [Trichonephila clavipes]|nr:hypothetical protein TNCV_2467911 [Trichonephila clavipes]